MSKILFVLFIICGLFISQIETKKKKDNTFKIIGGGLALAAHANPALMPFSILFGILDLIENDSDNDINSL